MKCKDCGDVSCTRRRSENSECFFEEDLRKQKELEEMPYWEHFRAEAAKDILCAMIQGGYYGEPKKVGSNGCSECKYFKSTDIDNNEVDCFYQEHETAMFIREYCDEHKRGD